MLSTLCIMGKLDLLLSWKYQHHFTKIILSFWEASNENKWETVKNLFHLSWRLEFYLMWISLCIIFSNLGSTKNVNFANFMYYGKSRLSDKYIQINQFSL